MMTHQIEKVEKTVLATIAQSTLTDHEMTIKCCVDAAYRKIGQVSGQKTNKDFEFF